MAVAPGGDLGLEVDVDSGQTAPSPTGNPNPNPNSLYSANLLHLREDLAAKYALNNIGHVSYALAVDLNCLDSDGYPRAMLADRNKVAAEYPCGSYTFYPLGFHPTYGNFQSNEPPGFLAHRIYPTLQHNMSEENLGCNPLSFGAFQGYSNLKRSIRHSHGLATGTLTLPGAEADKKATARDKQQRLLRQLRGERTPDHPDASKPFARERERVHAAIDAEQYGFRFE
ncbi:hypothetical protein FAUST_10981 [Fusarium austroamericanum]|uniref:Uncharacterized protein n=1 Tax=Fusarium austroamericanum TaxID=282268 RepID=A0AAN5YZT0_FUSAU|nr:hypothetical protein FAUST_10981 [Fusarium austroamericanum]